MPRQLNGKKVLSENVAGTTGYLHAKEWISTPTSYCGQKLAKMNQNPRVRAITINLQ